MTSRLRNRQGTGMSGVESGLVVWLVALAVLGFSLVYSPDFRSTANLSNLSLQLVVLGLAALAQFIVVIAGGVDLSIAANVRLASIAAAIAMNGQNDRLLLGVLVALAVGVGVGALNAVVVARLRIEPFVATLGTGAIVAGLALYLAPTPRGAAPPLLTSLYSLRAGPVYVLVLLAALTWLVAHGFLRHTAWGRHLYAAGGDPHVARLSGVRVRTVTASAYLIAGVLAAACALITLATTGIGDPAAANGLDFDSLTVVVLGGVSLAGGRGRSIGVIGGVILFGSLGNVFTMLRVDAWYQQLAQGSIILIAASIGVSSRRNRRAGRAMRSDGRRNRQDNSTGDVAGHTDRDGHQIEPPHVAAESKGS